MTAVKRRIANAFVDHFQRVGNRHAEEVRKVQSESGRDRRMLIRFDIFESDVSKRGFIEQEVYTYHVRVVDGQIRKEPPAAECDGHVMTDIPTLLGLKDGYLNKRLAGNGGVERIEPFTPRRAWFMGRILTDGDATMLANLMLFEKRVWGDMLDELRKEA